MVAVHKGNAQYIIHVVPLVMYNVSRVKFASFTRKKIDICFSNINYPLKGHEPKRMKMFQHLYRQIKNKYSVFNNKLFV